jgi:hypothetical protein
MDIGTLENLKQRGCITVNYLGFLDLDNYVHEYCSGNLFRMERQEVRTEFW